MSTMEHEYQTIKKPQIDNFIIYVDGEIDKRNELKRLAKHSAKLSLWATYKATEGFILAIDSIYHSTQKSQF